MLDAVKAMSPALRWLLACVGIAGVAAMTFATLFASRKGRELLNGMETNVMLATIPPIDAAAPAKFETATFALG